jgi:uncharacterized 2Fe-2S/4Fe-4S cluster protein (DUF4445 family)
MFLAGVLRADGVVDGSLCERTDRVVADGRTFAYRLWERADTVELRVTQGDVRAIQLAKAALRAGVELLRDHSGFDRIDDVRLAGAFGAHIDPLYALVLGLVPDGPLDSIRSAGNAAGSGAVRALLSATERAEMEAVVAKVTKIETATEPAFQQHFVDAMGFPHSTAPSPQLATVVQLPTPTDGAPARGGRRSTRRTR